MNWNVENVHQGKALLSGSLFRSDKCSVLKEKCLKLTTEISKVSHFLSFDAIFVKILTNSVN